jgi:hypothetical protein
MVANVAPPDEQPIARVVGRRARAPVGMPPSRAARAALDSLALRRTRVPKGVVRYRCHEDMIRDRDRWQSEAMAEVAKARA